MKITVELLGCGTVYHTSATWVQQAQEFEDSVRVRARIETNVEEVEWPLRTSSLFSDEAVYGLIRKRGDALIWERDGRYAVVPRLNPDLKAGVEQEVLRQESLPEEIRVGGYLFRKED